MPADHQHQLNLFPLHPENLVEDHKDTHDDDVSYFFSASDGGATTLTGLLGAGTASSSASDEENYNNLTNTGIALSTPETLTYAYGGQDSEEGDQQLVRTAMRNKAREQTSEEKWVCYSEVANSSSGVSVCDLRWKSDEEKMIQRRKRLSLKLDYEEIMNVWCDNIHLEYSSSSQPQVVPDFHDDDDDLFGHPTTSNDWGTNGGLWKVPEMSANNNNGRSKVEEVQGGGGGGGGGEWKIGQREASVLRYKEKRQNRLFSKKIRYEVRKLNAEKRPRIKGRFVKRN